MPHPPPPPGESAEPAALERLLAERFARGEIDEQEYRQRPVALQTAGHTCASSALDLIIGCRERFRFQTRDGVV
jgi:hypothetical protein